MGNLEHRNAARAGKSKDGVGDQGTFSEGTLISTYPTFSFSPREFAASLISARWHLPAPTARVVVELAQLGGQRL
jgi:hypothetical protein